MASVPFVVARQPQRRARRRGREPKVREVLELEPDVPIVPCDATDKASVKTVLLALLHAVLESLERDPARPRLSTPRPGCGRCCAAAARLAASGPPPAGA